MKTPEPILLQHMPANVAKRVDHWLGEIPAGGSVTVHKNGDACKIHVQIFETVEIDEEVPPGR